MTLSNKITFLRALLSLIVYVLLLMPGFWAKFAGLMLFAIAAATDYLDGKIARETNTVTSFGKIADPFVDKVLIIAAFMAFLSNPVLDIPVWTVFVIVIRELTITTLRVIAGLDGLVLGADRWGKLKTVVQMVSAIVILAMLCLYELSLFADFKNSATTIFITLYKLPYILAITTAVVTFFSGFSYIANNYKSLQKSWTAEKKQKKKKA
ncbi:MAG: CDP-diacylglycerol--glycerol-3-phosphate 3-phosphatidyltransferase [Elusimicrobiaceae bacterium]|nr:CDP-diacylglycerol--glycerol-3-phosphate 3-phosphatidyltransferase [Elusimicrobiaceae bacterium]MBT3955414.1 CDP-diacylglycerol--glycerol-3-phosphate 3-phosphatidyltransferase [Elusimicrobiaceae bacterium]MBT4007691.1 CDP-diacylglycerol--glycerol-3-phosphate 3-phosphatidyltransferase [Elusimicrobiaceae bacterium]MBT5987012.1 CDP-diacylglycerol--glycerol-3-phosphate 3-phosphatidyltransferase [Elusimicrobiaceae bacterium]MBT6715367.1 CDP-diacylglycerol--glycerol-3-phosphate 3-phosphatidyltrans